MQVAITFTLSKKNLSAESDHESKDIVPHEKTILIEGKRSRFRLLPATEVDISRVSYPQNSRDECKFTISSIIQQNITSPYLPYHR